LEENSCIPPFSSQRWLQNAATIGVALSRTLCSCFQILALEICAATMVGDEMLRGISGGQRKRVTTGKMDTHTHTHTHTQNRNKKLEQSI
jgi:predicted HAD superfamily phosphohydrolase YqeG